MNKAEECYLTNSTLYGLYNESNACSEYDPGAEADAMRELYYGD